MSANISLNNSSLSYSRSASGAGRPSEDYFNIDDILAADLKVPCKFELPVYRLGFLHKGDDKEHIEEGVKMELPVWLATGLNSRRRAIVSVELPKVYRESYREIVKADATAVDLFKLGPYYYTAGVKLLQFDHPEMDLIARCLLETFLNRFRRIMDSSQNAHKEEVSSAIIKLDETERQLFLAGHLGIEEFDKWQKGLSHKLTTATVIENQRKRRRLETDLD